MPDLNGKRIAILATNGFEQSELMEPRRQLKEMGAKVVVISPESGEIRGWSKKDWGESVPVDAPLSSAKVEDFHASSFLADRSTRTCCASITRPSASCGLSTRAESRWQRSATRLGC
jgi:hypothetical protein